MPNVIQIIFITFLLIDIACIVALIITGFKHKKETQHLIDLLNKDYQQRIKEGKQ